MKQHQMKGILTSNLLSGTYYGFILRPWKNCEAPCSSLQRKQQRSTAQSLSFDLSNTSFLVTSSLQSVINTTIFKLWQAEFYAQTTDLEFRFSSHSLVNGSVLLAVESVEFVVYREEVKLSVIMAFPLQLETKIDLSQE